MLINVLIFNTGLLICALLTCFFGICYLLFNPLVRHITLKQLVLRNNSEFAKIWENPPITPHLKVSQNFDINFFIDIWKKDKRQRF